MHDYPALIFGALLIFVFGLISRIAERWSLTGPMFFLVVGVLAGPLGLSLFEVAPNAELVKVLAEVTLIVILFVDATLIKHAVLLKSPSRLPARLLLIGLPLTIVFGAGFGALVFPALGFWSVLLLALILAPTDAALGQAVVKSEHVPERLRQTISVESGLNDGIALPPILVCFAALASEAHGHEGGWVRFTALQLTLGPLVGAAVGWAGGRLVEEAARRGWMQATFQRLSAVSLALIAFALAEIVGGNGFIAAFCGGLALGVQNPVVRERIQEFGEAEGVQLSLFVFLMLGMVMVPYASGFWGGAEVLYALASLTVIRMVPVAISMIGADIDRKSVAFLGWFGPRGVASVLYLLMAIAAIGVEGYGQVYAVIVLTVTISVVAHGLSAEPLTRMFRR